MNAKKLETISKKIESIAFKKWMTHVYYINHSKYLSY